MCVGGDAFLLGVDSGQYRLIYLFPFWRQPAGRKNQGADQLGLPDLVAMEGHKRERATEKRGPGLGAHRGLWPRDGSDSSSGVFPTLFHSLLWTLFISTLVRQDKP